MHTELMYRRNDGSFDIHGMAASPVAATAAKYAKRGVGARLFEGSIEPRVLKDRVERSYPLGGPRRPGGGPTRSFRRADGSYDCAAAARANKAERYARASRAVFGRAI